MEGHIARNCPTIGCQRCQKRGHETSKCRTRLNFGARTNFRGQNRWEEDLRNRDNYGGYNRTRRRYVNGIEEQEDRVDIMNEEYENHPKDYAPTEEEIVGAIY